MKKLFSILVVLSFFWMIGTVGALEQDVIPLGTAIWRMGIAFLTFVLSCIGCSVEVKE